MLVNHNVPAILLQPQAPGAKIIVPDVSHAHLFVATGDVALEKEGRLIQGDAARMTEAGQPNVTAGEKGAELLIWEMGIDLYPFEPIGASTGRAKGSPYDKKRESVGVSTGERFEEEKVPNLSSNSVSHFKIWVGPRIPAFAGMMA